jgi:hypothetical protein
LKENVIIGKLIPAGTGFRTRPAADLQESAGIKERRGHRLSEDIRLEDDELAEAEEFEALLVAPSGKESEREEAEETAEPSDESTSRATAETEGESDDQPVASGAAEADEEHQGLGILEDEEEDWALEADDEDEEDDKEDER